MHSHAVAAFAALAAVAEARFGQENNNKAVPAIAALSNFGKAGEAATLSGASISTLLAAADPCAKLSKADEVVSTLGNDPAVISAAALLVQAEQNFNPFNVDVPNICGDASLPATAELRGIVPLVDPAVGGSDVENANSVKSLTTPLSAAGLSVAQVMQNAGFSNLTVAGAAAAAGGKAASGAAAGKAAASGAAAGKAAASGAAAGNAAASAAAAGNAAASGAASGTAASGAAASPAASGSAAAASGAAAAGAGAIDDPKIGTFAGFVASSNPDLDFGSCVPTMKFEPGLDGRKDTEFTFQAQDPKVNKGQEEALNPAIIGKRISDQLTNVCGANQAAKDAATAAVQALSGKDAATADAWNTALGFAGTNLNPDGAPKAGLVGHD